MNNILSYTEEQLNTFRARPFHSVDSLILSWVANFRFPLHAHSLHNWVGLPLRDLFRAEDFPALFQGLWDPAGSRALLTALAASPRFREVRLMGYTNRMDAGQEMQFTAVTFQLRPDLSYVAFGGTDTSLVGWKENFNMTFLSPVPAQTEAARYLTQAAAHCSGDLLVGGHSKGGNLAVYAAASVSPDIQTRIRRVYSHDGPGFPKTFLTSPGYGAIRDRVEKTVPQGSVVGLLLESEACQVIQSSQRSILQHDPFSWTVEGSGFLPAPDLTDEARYWDRTLDDWVDSVEPAQREGFIDALYDILTTTHAASLEDLRDHWQTHLPAILKAAGSLEPDTRTLLLQTLRELGTAGWRNARASHETI
ncbi:MAG: DUF2974 domain-containing protein [Ruminiclostridium sp.]|nr:DUF2974 domain-containing protein [Ruminiclostridium sp.]